MPKQSERVPILRVNNTPYSGWKSVEVQNSLDQLAGTFIATVAFKNGIDIKMGDSYSLELAKPDGTDSLPFQYGWIDGIEIDYGAEQHDVTITGRDATCDLVDCSIISKDYPTSWRNTMLITILRALCDPFNILVAFADNAVTEATNIVRYARIEEGDKVGDTIVKLCKSFALWPISLGDGALTIVRAGSSGDAPDRIETGYNIESGTLRADDSQRFSKYVIKGQGQGDINAYGWPEKTTWQFKGEAVDPLISEQRYRPIVIASEDSRTAKEATNEAAWIAAQRVAQARHYEYKLASWENKAGKLWQLNSFVNVTDPFFDLDTHKLLIAEVGRSYNKDDGSTTTLRLVEPDCYRLLEKLKFPKTAADKKWHASLDISSLGTGFRMGQSRIRE